ncbi:uncharacterized protein LOC134527773 [Bacillus rossius redtenbacheri]|uniref:uncharacterized protein LOC134527773 n=1 Tax=Bacillus rossius redtenbacheri TaxID=93214 RepID=UPI002FDE3FB5
MAQPGRCPPAQPSRCGKKPPPASLNLLLLLFNQTVHTVHAMVFALRQLDADLRRGVDNRRLFHKKTVEAFNGLADAANELPDCESPGPGGYLELVTELSRRYLASCREVEKAQSEEERGEKADEAFKEAGGAGRLAVAMRLHQVVVGGPRRDPDDLAGADCAADMMQQEVVRRLQRTAGTVRDLEDSLTVKRRSVADVEDAINRAKTEARALKARVDALGPQGVRDEGPLEKRMELVEDIMRHHSLLDELRAKLCPAACPNCPKGPQRAERLDPA